MNALLRMAIREIRRAVIETPEDPADFVLVKALEGARAAGIPEDQIHQLAGVDVDLLEKSPGAPGLFDPEDQNVTLEERRGLALLAHEIRGRHGAPTSPGGWLNGQPKEVVDGILAMIPFRAGRLVPNRAGARVMARRPAAGPERRPVALVDRFHYSSNFTSGESRKILEAELGSAVPIPEVVLHPSGPGQEPTYTVISGAVSVFLARWVGLPALEMDVWEPKAAKPADPTMLPSIEDLEGLDKIMASKFAHLQYKVPPALEPVAELARDMERRQFMDDFAGRPSEEEIDARQEADLQNASRTSIWISLFRAAQRSGVKSETARRRADTSLEFRRGTRSWRVLERKAEKLEVQGHDRREAMRVAKAAALNLARELALPLAGPGVRDDFSLWLEARHGRISEDELTELEDRVNDPHPQPHERARRLPNHVSERRHPNLIEMDGAPGIFTFHADEVPHEASPGAEAHQIGEETFVPDANQPPPEAFRFENEPVTVLLLESEPKEGGPPGDTPLQEPALVVSTRE